MHFKIFNKFGKSSWWRYDTKPTLLSKEIKNRENRIFSSFDPIKIPNVLDLTWRHYWVSPEIESCQIGPQTIYTIALSYSEIGSTMEQTIVSTYFVLRVSYFTINVLSNIAFVLLVLYIILFKFAYYHNWNDKFRQIQIHSLL